MARPKLRKLAADIEAAGGDDYIFDLIADGVPMKRIAEPFGVSRPMLYQWRDLQPHREERRARWEAAMKASAEAKLEEGEEILDECSGSTSPEVQLANSRANYKMKIAEMRDPDRFGKKAGEVNVNLNIGQLHLDALRQLGHMDKRPQLEAGPVVEAVLEGDDVVDAFNQEGEE